jgi:aldose 1-epimerase
MATTVELAAGDARLRVAPAVGGALVSLRWRGLDVLRPTSDAELSDGNVRACASFPLVPYSNRIRDARLRFGAHDYALARNFGDHPHAIHGVGWQRPWRVTLHTSDTLALLLDHDARGDADRLAWPWPLRARQSFRLAARDDAACVLQMALAVENRGDAPFPFGLGWHPYFPRRTDTVLQFAAASVWMNDATGLPVACEAVPAQWRFERPRTVEALVVDNVFNAWSGHADLVQPTDGLRVALDADRACGRLVVYAPAGRDFIALEPVTHETDAFNRAAAGATSTGMRVLPPGAAFSCTMRLTVAALA